MTPHLRDEQRMPALLNAVGKMEVVVGNFDSARRDFEELVQIIPAEKEKAGALAKLANEAFLARAPEHVVAGIRERLAAAEAELARVDAALGALP